MESDQNNRRFFQALDVGNTQSKNKINQTCVESWKSGSTILERKPELMWKLSENKSAEPDIQIVGKIMNNRKTVSQSPFTEGTEWIQEEKIDWEAKEM